MIATTQKQIADTIGIGERTYAAWKKEGCPGRDGHYVCSEVIAWAKIHKWCKSSDPLLAGGDSDNLERYRGVKADLAEIDLQERRKEMVNLDVVRPALLRCLDFMKAAGEKLDRQFGNEALEILLDAWDQATEYAKYELSGDGENSDQ